MEVSGTGMHGTMTGAPETVNLPHRTAGALRSGQQFGGESAPPSNAQIEKMVGQMQNYLDSMNVSLQYSFYGAHGDKVAIHVVNKETGEVIREIPSKEMQALQTKMGELVGMIFNDNA